MKSMYRPSLSLKSLTPLQRWPLSGQPTHRFSRPLLQTTESSPDGLSANVDREGDRVVIQGDVRDLDLIEEIGIAAMKRGGGR